MITLLNTFIKALKGQSLTFALLFAFALLGGISLAGVVRSSLSWIDLWRPLVWISPLFLFKWLSRQEEKFGLRPEFKRLCAYLLVFGAFGLSLLIWRYQSSVDARYPAPESERERSFDRPRGPRR